MTRFWVTFLFGYGIVGLIAVKHEWPVLCPYRRLTGRRCPLCGVTTTWVRLIEGDVARARRATIVGDAVTAAGQLRGWAGGTPRLSAP